MRRFLENLVAAIGWLFIIAAICGGIIVAVVALMGIVIWGAAEELRMQRVATAYFNANPRLTLKRIN